MGWTSIHATHYRGHDIDRKKECDAILLEGLNAGWYEILNSKMIGSIYYAAVKTLKRYTDESKNEVSDIPDEEQSIWGLVCLTSVDNKDYFNFSYKLISEDMGPAYYDCPSSILKLLSPTNDEFASEWRIRCKERNEKRKTLKKLPIGAILGVDLNGEWILFQKMKLGFRKNSIWANLERRIRVTEKTLLNNGFEIVSW